ncbi:hypothetical protein [Rhizobium aouanii]|uniref:Uncharacterized protein n=1 Tax=Rhizobium aouanii TaxID=3118145 RepID=A0ABU8CHS4_9HYPH
MLELLGHALIGGDDVVEGIGDLAGETGQVGPHPYGKVAAPDRDKDFQKRAGIVERHRFWVVPIEAVYRYAFAREFAGLVAHENPPLRRSVI